MAELQRQAEKNRGREQIGLPTPYREITTATGGLQAGHLWVLGGYTSVGKSALANEFVYELICRGHRVVTFSLEMSALTTMLRVSARHSGVTSLGQLMGAIHSKERAEMVEDAFMMMDEAGYRVYEDCYQITAIRAALAAEHKARPVELAVVDFIQNLMGQGAGIYERMAGIAIQLQMLARDSKIPILALSQVSHESVREGGVIIGYKGAGEIAAAADVGLWLERTKDPKPGQAQALLTIRKNRHGPLGAVHLRWENDYTKLAACSDPEAVAIGETISFIKD